MPKTTKKETETPVTEEMLVNEGILPLELDLGRQDLNQLVDKLNEVIRKVNS